MRCPAPVLFLVSLLGCHSAPSTATPFDRSSEIAVQRALTDADWRRDSGIEHSMSAAMDPVVAQLLSASCVAHDHQRRVLLENLANANTCAYKRRVVSLGTQPVVGSDGQVFQIPIVNLTTAVCSPGVLEVTERNLDLAIDGEGFFAVLLAGGSMGYTRDGRLQCNADGKLIAGSGNVLLPEITVPSDTLEIAVDPEGRVNVRTASSSDSSMLLGQITLHRFVNPAGLLAVGANVMQPNEASGQAMSGPPGRSGLGLLKQGFLERSNVQAVQELISLQLLERQHDAMVRVMQRCGLVVP